MNVIILRLNVSGYVKLRFIELFGVFFDTLIVTLAFPGKAYSKEVTVTVLYMWNLYKTLCRRKNTFHDKLFK